MLSFGRNHRMNTLSKLKQKKLFLFDIDGTLAIGNTLYEGSAALLQYIRDIGGRAYFITNNSTQSAFDYVEKFRRCFHLETTEDAFVTSGYVTLEFLKKNYAQAKIFVLGTASFIAELRRNGLHIVETAQTGINCVVVAYDSELNYSKLAEVCHVLFTNDIPFYATNPDLRCPAEFGFIPDCGAICDMITATTDKSPVYLGKPSKEMVELCISRCGFTAEETLVVGDRLYTDIACGINAGVDTCVVFTGEAKPEDMSTTPYKADYAFDNIQALYKACTS